MIFMTPSKAVFLMTFIISVVYSLFIVYSDSHTPALIMYHLAMLLLLFGWPLTLHGKV